MIKKVTIRTENTLVEIERATGEATYTTRIWFIPFGAEPGAEFEPLINAERGDNVFGNLSPAKVEEIIEKCKANGHDIIIDDPEAEFDIGPEQNH